MREEEGNEGGERGGGAMREEEGNERGARRRERGRGR